MLKIMTTSLLGLAGVCFVCDPAQACGRRCCRPAPCCAAPACQAPAAPAGHQPEYDAPAPPPATAQAGGDRQAYRSFSAEPTAPMTPAPVYRTFMPTYRQSPSALDSLRADHKLRGNY